MPRPGRRTLTKKPITIKANIPEDLYMKVRLLLLNPVKGKIKYGAMSSLIQKLLTTWVKSEIGSNSKEKETENAKLPLRADLNDESSGSAP